MIDLSNQMIYRIGNLNNQSERISYQMSTGKILENGSDDSVLYARYLDIENKLRDQVGLKEQINKTVAQNNVTDATIAEVKTTLTDVKTDILRALNAAMTPADRKAVATNLSGMRENLLRLANTQVDGEYIFAGSNTTKTTFVKDNDFVLNGKINFGGNAHLRDISVGPNTHRERGVSAVDVFMYNTSTSADTDVITFTKNEMIVDEHGYTWQFVDQDNADGDNDAFTGVEDDRIYKINEDGTVSDEYMLVTGDSNDPETFTTETITLAAAGGRIRQETATGMLLEVKHNVFDDINVIINALKGYTTQREDGVDDGKQGAPATELQVVDTLSTYIEKVDNQYSATNIGHAELGGRNKVFETYIDAIDSKITHYNILIQETNGADMAKLAMESKSLEITYNALFSTVAKMNQLSLVNFIK